MKKLLYMIGIIFLWFLVYVLAPAFDISDQSVFLALIAVGLVAVTLSFENRIDSIEERVNPKIYSEIKFSIEEGLRYKPQNNQPKSLISGGALQSMISPSHDVIFNDFQKFGKILNANVSDSWVIEEINETSFPKYEGPEFGRSYRVYYNACKIGTMQVTVGGRDWFFEPGKFAQNRQARVYLELSYIRFIPYIDAKSLIGTIVFFMGSLGTDSSVARSKSEEVANAALTEHLWETVRNPAIDTTFDFTTEGPYELLRELANEEGSYIGD